MMICNNGPRPQNLTPNVVARVMGLPAFEFGDSPTEPDSHNTKFNQFAILVGNAATANFAANTKVATGYVVVGTDVNAYSGDLCTAAFNGDAMMSLAAWWQQYWYPLMQGVEYGTQAPSASGMRAWIQCHAVTDDRPEIPSVTAVKYIVAPDHVSPSTASAAGEKPWKQAVLEAAALRVFPHATFAMSEQVDPDEGWKREILCVQTGVNDIDARMVLEDQFYADVTAHEATTAALRAITVVFE